MAAITSMLQVNLPQSFAACRLTWQCLLPSGSSCAPRRWSGCVPCWALKWPTSSGRLPPPPFDTAPPADTQQLLLSGAPCRTAGRCAEPSSPCCPPGWRSTPCRPPPGCRWPWIRPSKPASCSQKQDGVSASVPLSSFSSKRFDVLLAGGFLQEILVCLPERVQETLLQQLVQILSVSWNRDAIKKRSSEDPIWTGSETHLRGTSWPGSGEGFQRRIETLERRRDHQTRRNTRRENCRDTETPRDWFPRTGNRKSGRLEVEAVLHVSRQRGQTAAQVGHQYVGVLHLFALAAPRRGVASEPGQTCGGQTDGRTEWVGCCLASSTQRLTASWEQRKKTNIVVEQLKTFSTNFLDLVLLLFLFLFVVSPPFEPSVLFILSWRSNWRQRRHLKTRMSFRSPS